MDPLESKNLVEKPAMHEIRIKLAARLWAWQQQTNDPWLCAPHGVLQDKGEYKDDPQCLTLGI